MTGCKEDRENPVAEPTGILHSRTLQPPLPSQAPVPLTSADKPCDCREEATGVTSHPCLVTGAIGTLPWQKWTTQQSAFQRVYGDTGRQPQSQSPGNTCTDGAKALTRQLHPLMSLQLGKPVLLTAFQSDTLTCARAGTGLRPQ